jgi:hypothetical protein
MTAQRDTLSPPRRPIPITIICIVFAIGALFAIPLIFSQAARSIGAWYPPYAAFGVAVGLASTVGLWLMRKWAVYLYTAVMVVNQIVLVSAGLWNIFALIPLVIVIIGFCYLSRMR